LKFLLRCINSVRSFFVSHSSFPSNYDELILQFLSHFKKTVHQEAQDKGSSADCTAIQLEVINFTQLNQTINLGEVRMNCQN
jgi:hypothetical protein